MLNSQIDKYLDKILKIILASIFFLPFVISADFYFPFIAPRNFLFRIIVGMSLALYLFLFFRNKQKYSFGKNKLVLAYLALAFIMTLASLLGGDFLYSFWSNYERMEGLLGLYYLVALLLVILGVYRRKKAWLDLLRISVWSSLPMAIMAMSQHWNINLFMESSGGERVTGTTGNATYLAVYALFNLFFALYLFFKDKNRRPKLELWFFYTLDILLIIAELASSGQGILAELIADIRVFLLFIIPQIFINLQYYFYNSKKTIKYSLSAYFILIVLLNFLALINTHTRGVLLGLFIAIIIVSIFLLFSKYIGRKFKYFILGSLVIIVFFVASIFIFKNTRFIQSNNILKRVASISISDATAETRLLTWQLSLKGFKEKPILGWGEEKFYVVFNKYFPESIFKDSGSRVWFDRPHNVFLQQLVHGGILALLAYLAIFFLAFKNLWRHYKQTHNPITISIFGALLIAYLVQNFFVFDNLNSYVPLIIFLAITIFLSGDFKGNEKNKSFQASKSPIESSKQNIVKANNKLAIASVLVVLFLVYILNIPQLTTNHNFIAQYETLRKSISQGKYKKADTDKLLEIMDSQYFGKFELRQVYAEFVPSLIESKALSPLETKYFIDTAEAGMLKSIDEQPDNVRHHSFLLNLYLYTSSLDASYAEKAVALIENKAIPLSPTRIQLYYSLGQAYMSLGQKDQAVASFLKAKELAPKVFDSYYNLIYTYLNIGDFDAAETSLKEMHANVSNISNNNYMRLAALYNYFGKQDEVDKIINGSQK